MALFVNREQVIAFRLARHNLAERLPAGSLQEAAGACGIQNSPPGSAALALCSRVSELSPDDFSRAVEEHKTLLQGWSLRGVPYLFPTQDARLFTTALLPADEESLRHFILGAGPALDRIGMTGIDAVERTGAALMEVLDGHELTFRQLSAELTERLAHSLSPSQLAEWNGPSWYGPNQNLGEAVIHFVLRIVALEGIFCFAPRQGNEASFLRTDQWLGEALPQVEPNSARAGLLRRYLRCYGPSTADHFAEWAGISPTAAGEIWRLLDGELVEVEVPRGRDWLLRGDLAALESAPMPDGVRLLPPHDPFLLQRDRETLVRDRALHRQIWKRVGNPGVVLASGEIVGIWRPQKKDKRLSITVESFTALRGQTRENIAREATLMAPFRGCISAEIIFAT